MLNLGHYINLSAIVLPALIFTYMKTPFKNFDKSYSLYLACGLKNTLKISMHYIMFSNGYAYATDSYILVKARLTDISDFDEQDLALLDGKFIHANNFKKIVKSKGEVLITSEAIVVKERECEVAYPLKTKEQVRFPDCEKIMNEKGDNTPQVRFGILADNLCTLSDVMNAYNGIVMEWKSNRLLAVTPIDGHKDIKGVIMTKMCL